MTSTNTDPYAEFRFAPDPAERLPLPGEWFGDLAKGPLWCDGYEGEIGILAHVYSLSGDLSSYMVPQRWRWRLQQQTPRAMFPVNITEAADTAAEAMRTAEDALVDYYAKHRPAEGYAALVAQARHAGFVVEEEPAIPGGAGAGLDQDEPHTIRVSVPDDDADDTETRQALTDLAHILADDSRAVAAPDTGTP